MLCRTVLSLLIGIFSLNIWYKYTPQNSSIDKVITCLNLFFQTSYIVRFRAFERQRGSGEWTNTTASPYTLCLIRWVNYDATVLSPSSLDYICTWVPNSRWVTPKVVRGKAPNNIFKYFSEYQNKLKVHT